MGALRRFDRAAAITVVGVLSLGASSALADVPQLTDFLITIDSTGDAMGPLSMNWETGVGGGGVGIIEEFGSYSVPGAPGVWEGFHYVAEGGYNAGGAWSIDYLDVVFNPDPFVVANLAVTNNTANTQTFSIRATLPITPALAAPTDISGSIVGTLTDVVGDGATVSSATLYTAFVDGQDPGDAVATLGNGFSLSNTGGVAAMTPESFSASNGPAVLNEISVLIEFDLTAFDTFNFTAIFEVVPTPGALSMFAVMGLLGGSRRRR